MNNLSCALLHPNNANCTFTYLSYCAQAFPTNAKLFTLIYTIFALTKWRTFLSSPSKNLNALAARILKTTFFMTSAIGTAWSSICLFQCLIPGHVLPTRRWFLSGFLAGMWALVDREHGRGRFTYVARLSMDSLWKLCKKKGWFKGGRAGEVWLFVLSLAMINTVYEARPGAVRGAWTRKSLGLLRGEARINWPDDVDEKGKATWVAKQGDD
jgi:hypothetical protein